MRNWLILLLVYISWSKADEYFVTKTQSDLVLEGRYLLNQNNNGKQFWICVDYEASTEIRDDANQYPTEQCGGSPKTENNIYWYAIHGNYNEDNLLSVRFESAFQVWPRGETGDSTFRASAWRWFSSFMKDSNSDFKVIQSHDITNYNTRRNDVDTLLLIGSGSVHVRGVKDGSPIHIRVKSSDETGITLEKVYQAKYNEETGVIETEDSIKVEETTTELPFYHDFDFSKTEDKPETENKTETEDKLDIEDKPETEEVTTKTGLSTESLLIDSEPFEVVHKNDDETTTTQEPRLLVRIPEFDDDGTQARPSENIPFVDPRLVVIEPVYDQNSGESRQQGKFNNFDNEIPEEDETTTTQAPSTTTQENVVESDKSLQDIDNSNQESFADFMIQESELSGDKYQLLYTVAIGTACAFLVFFIIIVLFRCYAWNKSDKINSYSPQTQKKHVVYTIGSVPVKVVTQ